MAIFMDTGGGDIYAGETREACLDAIRHDIGDKEFAEQEGDRFEVKGSDTMRLGNGETITLDYLYKLVGTTDAYLIALENC